LSQSGNQVIALASTRLWRPKGTIYEAPIGLFKIILSKAKGGSLPESE
jgi:hypothetical protein